MKVHNLFVSLAMFFVLTAASFAQQVKTDYDRTVNFDQYKTYSASGRIGLSWRRRTRSCTVCGMPARPRPLQ